MKELTLSNKQRLNVHEWEPSCSKTSIIDRATLYLIIRQYFLKHEVLEVETPILSQAPVSDPNIEPMRTIEGRFLHTSPEYAMKRLLCSGSGDIYQICKVFRDGEAGRKHNPEFSMLEWYRVGWSYEQLMDEVALLTQTLLDQDGELPIQILTYRQSMIQWADLDPMTATDTEVAACGIRLAGHDLELDRDAWLDVIMSHAVEPSLPSNTLVFIQEFPASQAALAKVVQNAEGHQVAQRFELYWNGSELANGYQELTDPNEQRRRFLRQASMTDGRMMDERFLAALEAGMPECAGVAIGLDRILMHRLGESDISGVLSFDWDSA